MKNKRYRYTYFVEIISTLFLREKLNTIIFIFFMQKNHLYTAEILEIYASFDNPNFFRKPISTAIENQHSFAVNLI